MTEKKDPTFTQVPEVEFIKAVCQNETLEAAGVALKEISGKVIKPASMYQRYNKIRTRKENPIALPDRPQQAPKRRTLSSDEGNALVAELLGK